MARATRLDWKCTPFSQPQALAYEATFTDAEYERICEGFIPEVMEDKWFFFSEEDTL